MHYNNVGKIKGEVHLEIFFVARLKCYCSSSRKKCVVYLLSILFVRKRRSIQQNDFHLRHLEKDLGRARPVTSDVSHCVSHQGCSFKMQKTRNFAARLFLKTMIVQSSRAMSERHN